MFDLVPSGLPRTLFLLLLALCLPLPALGGTGPTGNLLTLVDLRQDGVGDDHSLSGIRGLAASADAEQVYSVAPQDDALAAYDRNAETGGLELLEAFEDGAGGVFGLEGAVAVAVSPDGAFVYAVAEADDTLAIWSRDDELDELTFLAAELKENGVGGVDGLEGPTDVAVSRDWQIFVTGQVDDAVAVFSRGVGARHSFVEAERDGAGGVEELDGASAVAVSPDALHVYVAARIDDAVTVFGRSGGGLDVVTSYKNGLDGVSGLDGAVDLVVSPDNAHVYVVGEIDGTVAAFSRDTTTGELTFIDTYATDGGGLDGATSIAVDPQGRRVLVTSRKDNALAVFRRDPETGMLAHLETQREGVDGATGLLGATGVVISSDSAHVYVAAMDGNALSSWSLAACIGDEAMGDSDEDGFCDDVDLCAGDDLAGDGDGDSVCDDVDACPGFPDQDDDDGDLVPDGCDLCRVNDGAGDSDGDGLCDDIDPDTAKAGQPAARPAQDSNHLTLSQR